MAHHSIRRLALHSCILASPWYRIMSFLLASAIAIEMGMLAGAVWPIAHGAAIMLAASGVTLLYLASFHTILPGKIMDALRQVDQQLTEGHHIKHAAIGRMMSKAALLTVVEMSGAIGIVVIGRAWGLSEWKSMIMSIAAVLFILPVFETWDPQPVSSAIRTLTLISWPTCNRDLLCAVWAQVAHNVTED